MYPDCEDLFFLDFSKFSIDYSLRFLVLISANSYCSYHLAFLTKNIANFVLFCLISRSMLSGLNGMRYFSGLYRIRHLYKKEKDLFT
jgi:hypothetical protein